MALVGLRDEAGPYSGPVSSSLNSGPEAVVDAHWLGMPPRTASRSMTSDVVCARRHGRRWLPQGDGSTPIMAMSQL